MATATEMGTYVARLESFQHSHQLSKRRASSQSTRRKNGQAAAWPHERPRPEDLARAGFYFRPTLDNPDNVQCFFCDVKLDGWESEDNALSEHVAHSSNCAWAKAFSVTNLKEDDTHDPMDAENIHIRTQTFTHSTLWPHESKRGWKCKTKKMVEAGWIFDPSPDYDDGVTCCYCELSLDGWEPKDDPRVEHQKRAPDCAFFTLAAQHDGTRQSKPKPKSKGRARGSTASKASRLSIQSSVSVMTDMAGFDDDEDALAENVDDTIASTDTVISQANTKVKRSTKSKQPSKKGRKRTESVATEEQPAAESRDAGEDDEKLDIKMSPTTIKQTLEPSNVAAVSPTGHPEPKKSKPSRAGGTRKKKAQTSETHVDAGERSDQYVHNDASTQLQDELDQSISMIDEAGMSSTHAKASKVERGVKRMSDGSEKQHRATTSSAKANLRVAFDNQEQPPHSSNTLADDSDGQSAGIAEAKAKETQAAKKAKKTTKPKKISSVRSSQATVTEEQPMKENDEHEDLDRDEEEIEAELARMAADAQRQTHMEGDNNEYEASPSRQSRHSREIAALEAEINATNDNTTMKQSFQATPSPSASDKENVPSSSVRDLSGKPSPTPSPTKTIRIPLAASTPNRTPARTSKLKGSGLISSVPWEAVDLDHILVGSPAPTPRTLGERLAGVAGALSSPEKRMTVEEWVRWRAVQGDNELRQKCEQMVGCFEREGMRALHSLEGLQTL